MFKMYAFPCHPLFIRILKANSMCHTHKPSVLALSDGVYSLCEEEGNIQHAVCTMHAHTHVSSLCFKLLRASGGYPKHCRLP